MASAVSKLGKCANCLLFKWAKPGVAVKLQQCKQCKVLEYCGQACQEEHWKLIHKNHCKKMARAFEEEGKWSIFSHHPFPEDGLVDDIGESLVVQLQRILAKMKKTANGGHNVSGGDLRQLEIELQKIKTNIWVDRKLGVPITYNVQPVCAAYVNLRKSLSYQGEWSTFLLLLGSLRDYEIMREYGQLKEPQRALPAELWTGVEQEVGTFPERVKELLDFITFATEVPPFEDLLKLYCGGSVEQICSFCENRVKIEAAVVCCSLYEEAVVCVKPFLPLLFCCTAMSCLEALAGKLDKWGDFAVGVNLTFVKLTPSNQCDHCFKVSDDVHRYINSCKLNEESRNDIYKFFSLAGAAGV